MNVLCVELACRALIHLRISRILLVRSILCVQFFCVFTCKKNIEVPSLIQIQIYSKFMTFFLQKISTQTKVQCEISNFLPTRQTTIQYENTKAAPLDHDIIFIMRFLQYAHASTTLVSHERGFLHVLSSHRAPHPNT
jgi:hypothetical protein